RKAKDGDLVEDAQAQLAQRLHQFEYIHTAKHRRASSLAEVNQDVLVRLASACGGDLLQELLALGQVQLVLHVHAQEIAGSDDANVVGHERTPLIAGNGCALPSNAIVACGVAQDKSLLFSCWHASGGYGIVSDIPAQAFEPVVEIASAVCGFA